MQDYSCLSFVQEISEQTIFEVLDLLKQGTKVHFFTYDPIDNLLENNTLKKAVENQLLFCYETKFNDKLQEDFAFFNGNVPAEIINILFENAPLFNKAQFAAEHAPLNKNISVLAGAGTGKTTLMINRILFLKHLQNDINFADIALITFTNKAALHMREKLIERLKVYFDFTKNLIYLEWIQELKHIKIGTIHSFAHHVLLQNQNVLFDSVELPISQFNYIRKRIIEEVINEYHEKFPENFSRFKFIEQYKIIDATEAIMDRINNYSISLNNIQKIDFGSSDDHSHSFYEYLIKESFKRLHQYKEEIEYLDVHDLITKLESFMNVDSNYSIPYKYIFIDEFQDTDRQQTKFFAYLSNHYKINLFVVGDVKQSIYRFRGADYTAFEQLQKQTRIDYQYYLQLNYRSIAPLLVELNEMFATWPLEVSSFKFEQSDHLFSGKDEDTVIDSPFMNVDIGSHIGLVNKLREFENTDTAVLVRTNREVNELSMLCDEHKIFYTADQDGDFYRSLPVREFYQLIRRFTHPSDWKNRYLLHISSYGERTVETKDVINNFSPERTLVSSVFNNLDTRLNQYEEKLSKQGIFAMFMEIINYINPAKVHVQRYMEEKKIQDEIDIATLKRQARIIYQEYQLNLNQLILLLKKELQDTVPSLLNIEAILRLKMGTDKTVSTIQVEEEEKKRLKIMTVHKAKGLEFDHVFLPFMDRGFQNFIKTDVIIDNQKLGYRTFIKEGKTFINDHYTEYKQQEHEENVGEEVRLLYVALTRAKKRVYLNAPDQTNNHHVKNWGDLIAKGREKTKYSSNI